MSTTTGRKRPRRCRCPLTVIIKPELAEFVVMLGAAVGTSVSQPASIN